MFTLTFAIALPGQSQEKLGGAAACAVKRTNLDKRIAWKARDTGADLKEGFEVGKQNPTFDEEEGLWTVSSSEVGPLHLSCLPSANGTSFECNQTCTYLNMGPLYVRLQKVQLCHMVSSA